MKLVFKTITLVFLVFSPLFFASAYTRPGRPTSFVNDYARILSANEKSNLDSKLATFAAETSNEISVVTIKSLDGDYIENYAVKLFEDWKIGSAKNDNGVLLLIALEDRQMRIETGYGLEGALPDATAFQIINNDLKPAFQAGRYYEGIDAALNSIIDATKGEYSGFNKNDSEPFSISLDFIVFLFFFGIYLLDILWRWLAKSKAWWHGGALGVILGVIIAIIFSVALTWFIVFPLLFLIVGLMADYLVSRILPQPKPRKPGQGGLWFLGGGRGGGGFGGFGGGRSGGGGASGSW